MTTTTTTTISDDLVASIKQIILEWKEPSQSPTALQIYQIAKLLSHDHHYHHVDSTSQSSVRTLFRQLFHVMSSTTVATIVEQLHNGLFHILRETKDEDQNQQQEEALAVMAEIDQLVPYIPSFTLDQITLLVQKYEKKNKNNHNTNILAILAMFLLRNQLDWEDYLPRLHFLVQDTTDETTTTTLWNDLLDWFHDHIPGWQQIVIHKYPEHSDYLVLVFQKTTTTTTDEKIITKSYDVVNESNQLLNHPSLSTNKRTSSSSSKHSIESGIELQRRIDQVLQIVPDFGEGFVELCLAYYKGDVEQTVTALIHYDDTHYPPSKNQVLLPPSLRLYDRHLPRRKIESVTNNEIEQEEAKQIAKAALLAAQRQQEEEAYMLDRVMRQSAHDEYNDDYDDQYDDTEGSRRASDQGLYDDYDAVRTYNRVLKGIIEEQEFWEEDRNTNHQGKQQTITTKGDTERTYRGVDKLKGGRIPNPSNGRGRDGSSGGGRGMGNKKNPPSSSTTNSEQSSNTNGNNSKGNQKAKDRKLANRREKQKNAAAKRNT